MSGRRRRRGGGHGQGHHGGAWKVAYADFVTAMMAFFLLLWLLNAVSQEQLEGISDYFAPISKRTETSGGGGLLEGNIVAQRGVFESDQPSSVDLPVASGGRAIRPDDAAGEDEQLAGVETALRAAVAGQPELAQLAKSLMIEITPEGLRIQIVDQDGLPMFPVGQAIMYQYTHKILEVIAGVIGPLSQQIEIAGHTDATPFAGAGAYGNWELSADRANAARRTLAEMGIGGRRVAKVVGHADSLPLLPQDPAAPGNRRLTITLLRGTGLR